MKRIIILLAVSIISCHLSDNHKDKLLDNKPNQSEKKQIKVDSSSIEFMNIDSINIDFDLKSIISTFKYDNIRYQFLGDSCKNYLIHRLENSTWLNCGKEISLTELYFDENTKVYIGEKVLTNKTRLSEICDLFPKSCSVKKKNLGNQWNGTILLNTSGGQFDTRKWALYFEGGKLNALKLIFF